MTRRENGAKVSKAWDEIIRLCLDGGVDLRGWI